MNEPFADLQKLERDAFRRFYEDGIFDIYMGLMLLVLVAMSVLEEAVQSEAMLYLTMLGLALLVTVPLLAYRRRLLRERLGTFQPGPHRKLRITRTRWVLLASVVVGLVAFALGAWAYAGEASIDLVAVVVPLLWFVNAVVVLGAMAYLLDVPRFYAYGLIGGTLMPLMIWPEELWGIEIPIWLIFGLPALALVAFGLVKLRRFLRQYPAPQHG